MYHWPSEQRTGLNRLAVREADEEQPAFLDETGDVPGRSATTVSPTTTGTFAGSVYAQSPDYDRPAWAPPVDQAKADQAGQDFVLGFAGPTMKMKDVGVEKALKGIPPQWHPTIRERLRHALRAMNRKPDVGPQNLAERADLIRASAGAESKIQTAADDAFKKRISLARKIKESRGPEPIEQRLRDLDEMSNAHAEYKRLQGRVGQVAHKVTVERQDYPLRSTSSLHPTERNLMASLQRAKEFLNSPLPWEKAPPKNPWPPPRKPK